MCNGRGITKSTPLLMTWIWVMVNRAEKPLPSQVGGIPDLGRVEQISLGAPPHGQKRNESGYVAKPIGHPIECR